MTTRGTTSLTYSPRPRVTHGKLAAVAARVKTGNPKGVIKNMQVFGTAMSVFVLVAAAVGAPVTASAADHVLASGTFSGQSGHAASGGVSVVKTAKGAQVVLDPNFKFDGAPDPKLGFGKNGYVKSTQFSPLKSNRGGQTYEIPTAIEPTDYTEVWIWCEKYAVPLGVATLK